MATRNIPLLPSSAEKVFELAVGAPADRFGEVFVAITIYWDNGHPANDGKDYQANLWHVGHTNIVRNFATLEDAMGLADQWVAQCAAMALTGEIPVWVAPYDRGPL